MNGPSLQQDQNHDVLKDSLSQGIHQNGQVQSAQSKDNIGSPNDVLSAFNHKSSLSKLNQDLINSSFNQLGNTVTQQLADILFFCRKRLDENSVEFLTRVIPLDCEKEEMELIEAPELAQYIKQIINYLSKCKLEMETKMSQLIKPDEEYMNEYEGMLQKMEAECRNHIRIEQQLKIYAETAQERLEFVERDLEVIEKQNEELKQQLTKMTQTNEELINLNKQRDDKIETLKKKIKELEEQADKQLQVHHQSTSSLHKPSKIPLHNNNRNSIRDSIDHNMPANGNSYLEQNNSGGALPSSGGNSHKNLGNFSQNQSAHPSSNENSSQKHQGGQQQQYINSQLQQNKRNKRSVSTLNSGNEEGANTQREVMRQLENNASNRLKTEPYNNTSHSTGQNSNALKSTSSSHQQYNMSGSQNTQQNTYSQDALAYLLGNSNHKPSSSSSQNNRSSNNIKDDNKRIMEKYLFDKGDKAVLKKIYGDSAKSKSFIDLNKSQKNQNSSRGPSSSHASKGSQPSSSQNQQQNLIKQIQQQQIMKQVQSQQVLNRIQQKINQTIQNNGSSKNSNVNNSSGNLSNIYPNNNNNSNSNNNNNNNNNHSNSNTLSQSQTQRALSRSKSRGKFKEYSNDTSRVQKEYNIYTLNPQNVHKVQQAKASPQKNSKADTHRSQSVDAYSKINTKQSASYNLK